MAGNVNGDGASNRSSNPVYANFLTVSCDLSSFELEFAQVDGEQSTVQNIVKTSPAHIGQFLNALGGTIAEYERRFGPTG